MQPTALGCLLLSIVARCIQGHASLASSANSSCLVPVVCGYPPSTQWKSMGRAGLRGERGPIGKKGPRGIPGRDASSNAERMANLTERITQMEVNNVHLAERITQMEANNVHLADQLLQAQAAIYQLTESSWTDGFAPGNGYQYKVITGTSGRREGQVACHKIGSKVAAVGMRNQTSYNLIVSGITVGGLTQIGMSDVVEEGLFLWEDGIPASSGWTNWLPTEPNNAAGSEHCVHIAAVLKTWNDIACVSLNRVLCERPLAVQ